MKILKTVVIALVVFTVGILYLGGRIDDEQSESSNNQTQEETVLSVTPAVDIGRIANKSQPEVAAILGEPKTSSEGNLTLEDTTLRTTENTYSNGTEIVFAADKAVRITVYPPAGAKMDDGAALLGLTAEQAGDAYINGVDDYSWTDNTLYASVQAFNNGDKTISYIYVVTDKAYT